jgi:hypothetical protein
MSIGSLRASQARWIIWLHFYIPFWLLSSLVSGTGRFFSVIALPEISFIQKKKQAFTKEFRVWIGTALAHRILTF